MITQYDVTPLLKKEIPQLVEKVYPARISLQVYVSMNYFSEYTKHAVEEHDFNLAKKCFALANKLYSEGDRMVRLLVENIFVYSFSAFPFANKEEGVAVKSIIPPLLYALYIRQALKSGC